MRQMVYEKDMRERKRLQAEEKSIGEAERLAKKELSQFITSDKGIFNIREEAMKRIASKDAPKRSTISTVLNRLPVINSRRASQTNPSLRKIEHEIKQEYLQEKLAEARNRVIERNKKISIVMQSWMGLSLFDAFDSWRYVVEKADSQRRREARRQLKEEMLWYQDELAKYEYEKIDVS